MDEQFVAEEKDVALLTHAVKPMAKVPDRGEPEPRAAKPLGRTAKPDAEPQGKPRSYKRRDMKAED